MVDGEAVGLLVAVPVGVAVEVDVDGAGVGPCSVSPSTGP